jgi:type IV pilus assembly protein PilW
MRLESTKGFSLTELLVALVVSGVLIIGVVGGYIVNKRSYEDEVGIREMQMNAQVAMDQVKQVIMTAGLGCKDNFPPLGSDTLQGRFRNASRVLTISNRTNGPDMVTVVTGIRGQTRINGDSEGNVIALDSITGFDTARGRYLFVGPTVDNRYLEITGINGLLVTLSDSIKVNDQDQVFRINAYTITLDQNPDGTAIDVDGDGSTADGDRNSDIASYGNPVPDLYICDNMDDLADETVCKVAEGIEDIQFQYGWDANSNGIIEDAEFQNAPAVADEDKIRAVRIFVLARTVLPDPGYKDPNADPNVNPSAPQFMVADHQIMLDTNDGNGINSPFDQHYHRYLLMETVLIRNRNL